VVLGLEPVLEHISPVGDVLVVESPVSYLHVVSLIVVERDGKRPRNDPKPLPLPTPYRAGYRSSRAVAFSILDTIFDSNAGQLEVVPQIFPHESHRMYTTPFLSPKVLNAVNGFTPVEQYEHLPSAFWNATSRNAFVFLVRTAFNFCEVFF